MATRAATFMVKISNLKDYYSRMTNAVTPVPSGVDMANTLKYFSQTLLGVLKDIPFVPPLETCGNRQRDSIRLSIFPNLDYCGLYDAVRHIIEVVPLVQYGQQALGESILNVIGCLVPFLELEILDTLPYMVASTLAIFPSSLHKETVFLLCTNLLPVTLGHSSVNETATYATESTAAILMLVFQYVTNGEYHAMLLESLMALKKNIFKDLLCIIAYGPPVARAPAVHHLFYYWPQLNPALVDRRGIHHKFFGFDFTGWKPILCYHENCVNSGNVKAVKMCLDPTIATQCVDRPPPIYVCSDCVDLLNPDHVQYLVDVVQPIEIVSLTCENKNCKSIDDNVAICTCFARECASINGFTPIRYCRSCHELKHPDSTHVCHTTVQDIWSCDPEVTGYLVEAIVSLLKEAQPMEEKRMVEMGEERTRQQLHTDDEEGFENQELDDRKLLSRYGVWLLVEMSPPKENIPIEILGRLLAMLFQWFDATAYLPDDTVGNALDRLKPEYICNWLVEISHLHFEVILSCLLPHPPEYARVGGYCDTLASRTTQIKEGLNKLFCLVPYNIVSYEVWDYVMAFWLEAIRTEIPEDERHELQVLICKAFDNEMSPLSFGVEKMYHFIAERFENTTASVQEQNLEWLQIMTSLNAFIPIPVMLDMFQMGIDSMCRQKPELVPEEKEKLQENDAPVGNGSTSAEQTETLPPRSSAAVVEEEEVDDVPNLKCFNLMLELLLNQIKIQNIPLHLGIENEMAESLMSLLTQMLLTPWDGQHTCDDDDGELQRCELCEVNVVWYQSASNLVEFISPVEEVPIPVLELPKVDLNLAKAARIAAAEKEKEVEVPPSAGEAKKEEIPSFEPNVEALPSHLRLLYALIKDLEQVRDANAKYFRLNALKLLSLHSNCMAHTTPDDKPFLRYCLKELLVPSLWKLLKAENSHISSTCVPLLIYCLTQPSGADIFWKLVEDDFNNEDWKARFSAVEKAVILARLVKIESVQNNQQIKTSLAHTFCYLIGSLDDLNSVVVQRATLYLESIKSSSIECMIQCLEFQFDTVISDRTMILHNMFLLSVVLKSQEILTWEFFLNRFDALCLEAQLDLESSGDITSLHDLYNSDRQSDGFLHKINRARFALARTDSIRSVSNSLYAKPPYRRAASVPMHLLVKCLPPQEKEKEKSPYTRQQSAPQFRSRGSRLGLGMFANYIFPAGGHLREFTDGESNFTALLQRAMDLEGVDRETLHHLVSLIMKFMTNSDEDKVHEDRNRSKAQNTVLRHLNVLLGYNQTEKSFSVPPYKLRYSVVFNAFISGLAKVLDRNFALGNIILPVSMILLQYCPSPQRYASDYQPPNYTLWYLEPHTRLSWLLALLVILYKYQYNTNPASGIIHTLIRVTINTIDASKHQCRNVDESFGPSSPLIHRNRELESTEDADTSNVSVGDLENIIETETPPQSPAAPDTQLTTTDHPSTLPTTSDPNSQNSSLTRREREGLPAGQVKFSRTPSMADSPLASPLPLSPTSSRPSSPVLQKPTSPGARTHHRRFGVLSLGCGLASEGDQASQSPTHLPNPIETFLQLRQDQVRRIAEYNRDSLIRLEDVSSDKVEGVPQSEEHFFLKHMAPVETACSSETDENSLDPLVEEHQHATSVPFQTSDQCPETRSSVMPEILFIPPSPVNHPSTQHAHSHPLERFDKKFECILEEVKESDEEVDSPKRSSESTTSTGATNCSGAASTASMAKSTASTSESMSGQGRGTSPEQGKETEAAELEKLENLPEKGRERRLWKMIPAELDKLESLQIESEVDESPCPSPGPPLKTKPNIRQRKMRKTGLSTVEIQKTNPELGDLISTKRSPLSNCRARRVEMLTKAQQQQQQSAVHKQRALGAVRSTENLLVDRCPNCHALLESYDEETISVAIICLATFIHREPALAAPLLLDMLQQVSKVASSSPYPWQSELSGMIIPGNSLSVARQFIRCVLHQLAPNNVFPQLFMSDLGGSDLLKSIAAALLDFAELNSYSALQLVLEGVNETKTITNEQLNNIVTNLATFMDYIILENSSPAWTNILSQFDIFFRRLPALVQSPCDMDPILKIMVSILRIPSIVSAKSILEPFSKLLSHTIQNCSFQLQQLLDICSLCGRAFNKERDKLVLSRCTIFELIQAMKFKSTLPDENLLLLVQLVCLDAGGTLGPINIVPELASYKFNPYSQSLVSTNAAECMKQHLTECLEFIADLHTINRVKNNLKGGSQNLNEDTLGSHLKAGIAQFIALEFTRVSSRDNRIINRYLPWLYHPPSAMQQGPREFIDCVVHIRILSWLLLGSLMHIAVTRAAAVTVCQPLPLEASSYIADQIMVILTGFTEQSKASVLHMSSLFHAFILCQLWSVYCESLASMNAPSSEAYNNAHQMVMDFWGRVTPGVLQLLSHSKVLAEMVNLHFLSLIEALQECNSTVLTKLFSIWVPILYSYHSQLPGHMQVRLQMCQNWQPREALSCGAQFDSDTLLKWLKRLQFKLSQIEVQSSAATQFYTV